MTTEYTNISYYIDTDTNLQLGQHQTRLTYNVSIPINLDINILFDNLNNNKNIKNLKLTNITYNMICVYIQYLILFIAFSINNKFNDIHRIMDYYNIGYFMYKEIIKNKSIYEQYINEYTKVKNKMVENNNELIIQLYNNLKQLINTQYVIELDDMKADDYTIMYYTIDKLDNIYKISFTHTENKHKIFIPYVIYYNTIFLNIFREIYKNIMTVETPIVKSRYLLYYLPILIISVCYYKLNPDDTFDSMIQKYNSINPLFDFYSEYKALYNGICKDVTKALDIIHYCLFNYNNLFNNNNSTIYI